MGVSSVIRDYRGWLSVSGPRFYAFFPLGSKAQLEHDTLKLAEGFKWDPLTVKQLSCSERHRYVKMKEAIAAEEAARRKNQTTIAESTSPTGISPKADIPAVGIDYTGAEAP